MKPLWMLAFASASLFGVTRASAYERRQCNGDRPWVFLAVSFSTELAPQVLRDLQAGLEPNRIDACVIAIPSEVRASNPEPLARVSIDTRDEASGRFSVDVVDLVTQKRVGRDLDLGKLPKDGRSLALAVTAEELLRASWAELALRQSETRQPKKAAPPEVRSIVDDAGPEPQQLEPRSMPLGARIGVEHFLGGQTHYGVDAFVGIPLGTVTSLNAALGVRRALPVQATHGSIEAQGAALELGLSLSWFDSRVVELDSLFAVRGLWLTFDGEPSGEAEAESLDGLVVTARGGLQLALGKRGAFRSYTALGLGVPIQSLSATDEGTVVTGASELELFASTGLAWELP